MHVRVAGFGGGGCGRGPVGRASRMCANAHNVQSKMTNTSNRDNHDGAAQFLRDFVHWTPGNALSFSPILTRALGATMFPSTLAHASAVCVLRSESRLCISITSLDSRQPPLLRAPPATAPAHMHAPHVHRCPLAHKYMPALRPPMGLTSTFFPSYSLSPLVEVGVITHTHGGARFSSTFRG